MGRPALTLGVVIQARMASTRLPGKVLEEISGRPLLAHILGRLDHLHKLAHVVVATSDATGDNVLAAFCAERGVDCFRGSEQDVLARYHDCARERSLDHIVRLTGDNPFPDMDELRRLIDLHLNGAFDYSSSCEQLPIGVGAEIFTAAALSRSHLEGHEPQHREHVNEYILENPTSFRIGKLSVPAAKRRPDARLTVDTPEDLRRARFIAGHARDAWVTTEEAIALCSRFA